MKNMRHQIIVAGSVLAVAALIFPAVAREATGETNSVCLPSSPATTPTGDFTNHENGSVTHLATGLMWQVCSAGQEWTDLDACGGDASQMSWSQALQYAEQINKTGGFAGHQDWRLPNIKELSSIIEYQCHSPVINQSIFLNSTSVANRSAYWTSTVVQDGQDNFSWVVLFEDGRFDNELRFEHAAAVRLVRGIANGVTVANLSIQGDIVYDVEPLNVSVDIIANDLTSVEWSLEMKGSAIETELDRVSFSKQSGKGNTLKNITITADRYGYHSTEGRPAYLLLLHIEDKKLGKKQSYELYRGSID